MQLSMTHLVASAPTSGHPDEGEREPCQARVHMLLINLEGPSTGDAHITAMMRSAESERQNPPIGGSCTLEVEPPSWAHALLKCPDGLSELRAKGKTFQLEVYAPSKAQRA